MRDGGYWLQEIKGDDLRSQTLSFCQCCAFGLQPGRPHTVICAPNCHEAHPAGELRKKTSHAKNSYLTLIRLEIVDRGRYLRELP